MSTVVLCIQTKNDRGAEKIDLLKVTGNLIIHYRIQKLSFLIRIEYKPVHSLSSSTSLSDLLTFFYILSWIKSFICVSDSRYQESMCASSTCVINEMTLATRKKSCVKCPKGQGQVVCDGCQQCFCITHLLEHRKELSQQMEKISHHHDEIQQTLLGEDSVQEHPLFRRVDQWE